MAFITWTKEITVTEEIDSQHRKLFDMCNELHHSVTFGAERRTLAIGFSGMIDYTVEHFHTEERLFSATNYPDAAAHKKEHDELTETAVKLQQQFSEGNLVISFDLLNFLYDWLMNHTSGSDKAFGAYLREKGMVSAANGNQRIDP